MLYIIGDSFTLPCQYVPNYIENECYWVEVLRHKTNLKINIDGFPSRDSQTIIDHWIKLISFLKQEDHLIICFPIFSRTRLPLHESRWDTKYLKEYNIIQKFIGTHSYNKNSKIDIWDNNYSYNEILEKSKFQEIINQTKSSQLNYIEIIESLNKLTPCKTFIFSWDEMEYKSNIILDKNDLTNKIGYWETLDDVWIKSEGQLGKDGDKHWSFDYNKTFAEFTLKYFL